jgi:hypothetical protein
MSNSQLKRATLALGLALAAPLSAWSAVAISVTIAPPPLPLYAQPPIPGDGYIWTPGYWAWDPATGDYIWVPGTWVFPPSVGLFWTPGYWAFFDGGYGWHRGYWGPHVGYYGGINYGYGYFGRGYDGGRWDRGHFRYNTAVNNIPSGRVHDVYRAPVPQRPAHPESFIGGNSHWHGQPTASQRRFEGGQHPDWTREQQEHEHRAMGTPEQRMGSNHGMPPTAATPRPGGFGEPQVERARPAPEVRAQPARHVPDMRAQPVRPGPAMRPAEAPHMEGGPRNEPRAQPRGEPHGEGRGHPGGNRQDDHR